MAKKTVLQRIRDERKRATERDKRAAQREAHIQNQLTLAVERVAEKRLTEELGPIFRRHGHALVPESPVTVTFRRKADDLIARDRIDASDERLRALAEIEVADGIFVNLSDTVIAPTPEWLTKGAVKTFWPKQEAGTVRVIKTVRRDTAARVTKMHRAGKLSDEALAACLWYRDIYELAGLCGRVKSSNHSLAGNVGGGGGGLGQAPMALHVQEAEARMQYRGARDAIRSGYVRFFEAIVINDAALNRAAALARCRNEMASSKFRDCCNQVVEYIAQNKIYTTSDNSDA